MLKVKCSMLRRSDMVACVVCMARMWHAAMPHPRPSNANANANASDALQHASAGLEGCAHRYAGSSWQLLLPSASSIRGLYMIDTYVRIILPRQTATRAVRRGQRM